MRTRTTPRPKAIWTQAFPEQVKISGLVQKVAAKVRKRIRQRSPRQASRMIEYMKLRAAYLFLGEHQACAGCRKIFSRPPRVATDIHHSRGKLGVLLFDIRFWRPLCRECHAWVGDHPAEARNYDLLCQQGLWHVAQCQRCPVHVALTDHHCSACLAETAAHFSPAERES